MTPHAASVPRRRFSGRLVVLGVVLISCILGFSLLAWMFSYEPDTVDYDESGPTQPNVIFPPPLEDESQ